MREDSVFHSKYGRGVVQGSRFKGFELQVAFDDGLTRWIRLDELKLPDVHRPNAVVGPPTPPIFSDERFKSRRMVEAFRLGIVPYDCVEEFTFGRDKETRELLDWLDDPTASSLLLVGEYGTGKSHLLHYVYWRALQEGFAVAFVDMDPNESPFRKPKRIYRRLVQTFQYRPGRVRPPQGFREFLKTALAEGSFREHTYFRHLSSTTSDEKLWSWIEAQQSIIRPWDWRAQWRYSRLPGLYDYSTGVNIYCYLLSSLGWAAQKVMGLKGLLLLFDEAETVSMYNYSYQEEKNQLFLKALIRTASDEAGLLGSPMYQGLDYCGHGPRTPFLYRLPSGLKLLFAFTSLDWNYYSGYVYDGYQYRSRRMPKTLELESATRIELRSLSTGVLQEIFEHICLLYDSAYDFLEEDLTISSIFERTTSQAGRTRLFVKGAIEALDLIRLNSGQSLDEILR